MTKRLLIVVCTIQVISALSILPWWDSESESPLVAIVGVTWLISNLPGICLCVPIAVILSPGLVQADVFDGTFGYMVLIVVPTVASQCVNAIYWAINKYARSEGRQGVSRQ